MRELAVQEIAPHHGHFFEELGSLEDVYEGPLQWQGHESQLLGCVPYGAILGEGARAAS